MGKLWQSKNKKFTCDERYPLDPIGIESGSERIEQMLQLLEVDRQNRIRIRFSLEESLLRLQERFGEKQAYALKVDNWFGKTSIQIEVEGDVYNPLSKREADLEDWSGSLLTAVGLSPVYSYSKGKNILRVNLSGKGANTAVLTLLAVVIGLGGGLLLRALLPETAQVHLVLDYLDPVYQFFVRMLTVLSGPVVFLIVCTSVLNTRTIEEEGGSSTRVVLRYLIFSLLAALAAVLVTGPLSVAMQSKMMIWDINIPAYFEALLQVMPENAVAPLMESNTPQILLLAFTLGGAISALGSRAERLNRIVHEGSTVSLFLTEVVSRFVPFFVANLLCMEVVSGSLWTFGGMWLVLLLSLVVTGSSVILVCFYVSRRKRVSFRLLLKKLRPAFVTAVRAGNLDTGYGQMERSCVEELGMEKHFATVSLPYGTVLYMPANVIGTLIFTVYAATVYEVEITVGWIVVAMVLAVVLFVATPPVPGANLLAYIMIFAQLQIPPDALIDAMIFDILFGVFAAAANQTLLQVELLLQADRIGLLDKEKLRRPIRKSS